MILGYGYDSSILGHLYRLYLYCTSSILCLEEVNGRSLISATAFCVEESCLLLPSSVIRITMP